MFMLYIRLILVSFLLTGINKMEGQSERLPSEIELLINNKPFDADSYQDLLTILDTASISDPLRLDWIQMIIRRFDEGNQTEYQARSRQLLGSYLIDEGEYGEATKFLLEGLRIAEEYGHTLVEGLCHNGLAIMDYYRQQFEKAGYHWNKTVQKLDEAGFIDHYPGVLSNLGSNYHLLNMLDSAIFFHQRALELAEKSGQRAVIADALNNIGNVYYEQGNYGNSRKSFEQALDIQTQLGNQVERVRTMNNIGATYEIERQTEQALNNYREALILALETGNYQVIAFTFENLSNIYAEMGQFREAYESRVNYVNYHDSAFAEEQEMIISNLRAQYEAEKREQEIALLTRDRALSLARNTRQQILLIGSALLLTLMGILIWSISRGRRKLRELLLNILPVNIVDELNKTGITKARRHNNVSVLFADFINFTEISEPIPPEQLVRLLNQYFSAFDDIVERFKIEKIKTIGDNYMCAAGLTQAPDNGQPLVTLINAAREMIKYTRTQSSNADIPDFQLRTGIHTGPVVAGVVGKKKFAYDIWGYTVNTAARMEQNGTPDEITISEKTYDQIKNIFNCIPRGPVKIKGKGMMHVYGIEV